MPALGDLKIVHHKKNVWQSCLSCSKERWVQIVGGNPAYYRRCGCKRSTTGVSFRINDSLPRDKHGKRLVLRVCVDCQGEDWIRHAPSKDEPESPRCRSCSSRIIAANRRAGVVKEEMLRQGRMLVKLNESSPYFSMANKDGRVLRSRLVMAESLGRCLTKREHVHHIGDVLNDDKDNLKLMQHGGHNSYHGKKRLQEYRET